MNRGLSLLLVGFAVASGGCVMIPGYSRPASPAPGAWPSGDAYPAPSAGTAPRAADLAWKDFFADEKLRNVIGMALATNRDLRVAALTVEKARALYGIQRGALSPTVGILAGGDKSRLPAGIAQAEEDITTEQYSVNLGFASYELDLFGRIRSLKAAALEQYLASEQARRSAQISLVAEVANVYLALAADRDRLKLARDTLKAQQDTLAMIRRRFDVGASSEIDLRQAQTRMEAARVDIARYTSQVAQDENALNLLVGSPVPAEWMPGDLGSVAPLKEVAAGLPSEVLQRRPDILRAENQLKAANANIGAARAAFFPSITLTAGVGTMSKELSGLFKAGSDTWAVSPTISLPLFTGGKIQAGLDAAKVDREIALAQYEKAIQSAFREVADALAQRGTMEEQVNAQQAVVDAAAASYRLAETRFEKGIDSYLTLLDVQRSLYAAQQGLISLRLARLGNALQLYKVLGGGVGGGGNGE